MTKTRMNIFLGISAPVLGLALMIAPAAKAAQMAGGTEGNAGKPATMEEKHQDHEAKHGGTFFMAMDNEHHLEGTLEPSGVFRVYLYDAYTKPLPKEKVKTAKGTIQVGDAADAPKQPLLLSKDGKTLEIALPNVKFPFTLTLLMHFPDTPADARPELFTFPLSHYTNPKDHPSGSMDGMKMDGMKMDGM